MSSVTISVIVFACVFGGALLGLYLRTVLPDHHVSNDSKDVVKLATGLVATLAALVLGLLVASAKNSFDTINGEMRQSAAKAIVLDRVLARYGPEANEARATLHGAFKARYALLFPEVGVPPVNMDSARGAAEVKDAEGLILALAPRDDAQRWLQSRALQLSGEAVETRWLLLEQFGGSISPPFLVVLVAWLAAIFTGFGLFAPRHATAIVALLVGSLAVSTSIFLIEEMDHPLDGMISISSAPFRTALDQLGQ